MSENILFAAIIAAVFAYSVLKKALLRLTEPVRLEFADLGKQLLTAPDISEAHKEFISDMLDDVFSWQFMAMVTIQFPMALLVRSREARLSAEDRSFVSRKDVERFFNLHMRSVMAVSPIWTAMFLVEVLASVVIILLWLGFSAPAYLWIDTVKHVSPAIHNSQHNAHLRAG